MLIIKKLYLKLIVFLLFFIIPSLLHALNERLEVETISVAHCMDCVPFQFQNKEGKPDGIIIDLWKLWSKKTGTGISFHAESWSDSLTRVKMRRYQVHAGLFFNEQRNEFLDYGHILVNTDTHAEFV